MDERSVVFPALSRPRSRIEYSVGIASALTCQECRISVFGIRTLFTSGIEVQRLREMIHGDADACTTAAAAR